jgi:hypothetical protein
MPCELFAQLRARKSAIEHHWRQLLAIEPVSSPLANPEALQYLIPETFDRIMNKADQLTGKPITAEKARAELPKCDCGNNPYRAFFIAGEQAVLEAAVMLQAEMNPKVRNVSAATVLLLAVHRIARTEIDTFCAACVRRGSTPNCRFHGVPVGNN